MHACRSLRSAAMLLAALVLTALAAAVPAAAGCDDDDRPGAPHSLRATPLGSTGIMLQWSSNAGHYDIYIRDAKGRAVPEAPDITGGATNRNYLEFYGLKPDKEYFFSIRARTEGGTQGCVSKNASETVSARTDLADLDRICSNYEKTAQENIRAMRGKGCPLPGSAYSGIWATQKGAHFTYCLEQKRARLQGDANAQWQRNRDLEACNTKAGKCWSYAGAATTAELANKELKCGFTGPRWHIFISSHFDWCMSPSTSVFRRTVEARARNRMIRECKARKAKEAQGGGTGGGGGSCPVPNEWSDMLAAHNELRGQYCGSPLTWDCGLAQEAQKFAEECACGHSNAPGVGENLAAKSVFPDAYPAGSDRDAFKDTWACEKDLYDFNNPKIVGGFKENCKGPPEGSGVNGHFTQVVWKGNKQLGCGRARCPVKDKDCKVVPNGGFFTNWVCRYRGFDANGTSVGGNDSGKLAENVQKPPNCTTQKFHSRSVTTCFRGMVPTSSGQCACPTGTRWNGRTCAIPQRSSKPASSRPAPPPVEASRCPADRPNGTFPNCCPQNARFESGVCKQASSGGGGSTTSRREVCRSPRPVGTFPNCCPTGTFFSDGACRRPTGGGGTNGTQPGGSTPRCAGDRPVGTYPNCCPTGMRFEGGACRRPAGNGGSNGTQPTKTPMCSGARPVGTYPNCCPSGMFFKDGACRRGGGGTNGTQPTTTPTCSGARPVGTYPNCCPSGTSYQNGQCTRPSSSTAPQPAPSTQTNQGTCTGGRIGRPPYCRCPSGTRYLGGRCRRSHSPTNPGPAKKVCPSGLTGPDCDQIIVR